MGRGFQTTAAVLSWATLIGRLMANGFLLVLPSLVRPDLASCVFVGGITSGPNLKAFLFIRVTRIFLNLSCKNHR